ncbi:MAG: hypothetical protein MUP28_07205 [Candidatus Aminicenantes bacterium]|nr:hypothetical protein [Candidatus Aminicenantes bacterium]
MKPFLRYALYAFIAFGAAMRVFNATTYLGNFDGDPMIHVSFAENASRGFWFSFNSAFSIGICFFAAHRLPSP